MSQPQRESWKDAEAEDQEDTRSVQASLLDEPLRPLKPPEFTFFYRYTSGGKEHTQSIQDWEVQAAYLAYQKQYGSRDKALAMMAQEYGENIPKRNLHFIMGNMAKRQWMFIVIGLLRSGLDPDELGSPFGGASSAVATRSGQSGADSARTSGPPPRRTRNELTRTENRSTTPTVCPSRVRRKLAARTQTSDSRCCRTARVRNANPV